MNKTKKVGGINLSKLVHKFSKVFKFRVKKHESTQLVNIKSGELLNKNAQIYLAPVLKVSLIKFSKN